MTTGLWLGGLTFYAAVVVPIGTEIIGGTEQGFITQRVTNWLNLLGIVTLILLAINAWSERTNAIVGSWCLASVCQASLLAIHRVLDAQLDSVTQSIGDADTVYQSHRYYLIVTTVMWLAVLAHLWLVLHPNSRTSGPSNLSD